MTNKPLPRVFQPLMLTAPEFAKRLGVSRQFIARACTVGTIKATRQGKIWLIPRGELRRVKQLRDARARRRRKAHHPAA